MYADDIVLMSSSEEGLRKHLRSLEEFCKEWKLEVNYRQNQSMYLWDKAKITVTFSFKGNY